MNKKGESRSKQLTRKEKASQSNEQERRKKVKAMNEKGESRSKQ